jgi:hypothetical protein
VAATTLSGPLGLAVVLVSAKLTDLWHRVRPAAVRHADAHQANLLEQSNSFQILSRVLCSRYRTSIHASAGVLSRLGISSLSASTTLTFFHRAGVFHLV